MKQPSSKLMIVGPFSTVAQEVEPRGRMRHCLRLIPALLGCDATFEFGSLCGCFVTAAELFHGVEQRACVALQLAVKRAEGPICDLRGPVVHGQRVPRAQSPAAP